MLCDSDGISLRSGSRGCSGCGIGNCGCNAGISDISGSDDSSVASGFSESAAIALSLGCIYLLF